ncbi:MAG TPA: DNA-processing protein DprA [Candidatus Acidoferrum sp.]|nr:DNA-processing protein DprA [Candidatus Acidoferrum sp.]
MQTSQQLQRWLQLTLAYRFDAAQLKTLRQLAPTLEAACALTPTEYGEAGLSPTAWPMFAAWQQGRVETATAHLVEQSLAWSTRSGQRLIMLGDEDYPPLLAACRDAPPQLFVRGEVSALSLPQIAIVGSRKPTADGRRHAREFAAALVACGYQITSGLALGIDAESHLGALDSNGCTIAVLGTGLDNIYPKTNAALAERIVRQGALVSEFPPLAKAEHWHFPERNRIISGLAHGVLVVEAAEQSGSLITARLAAEQGREVFAIPGSINNPLSRGCHRLIRQGVKLVESAAEIIEELPALVAWEQQQLQPAVTATPVSKAGLKPEEKSVLRHIGYDPVSLDSLQLHSELPIAELLPLLTVLELRGLIEQQAQGYARTAQSSRVL